MLHSNRRCNRPDIRSPQFGEYGRADPLQDCPGYSISHRRALPGTLHMTCQSLALTCRKLTDRRCAARAPIVQSGDVDRQVAEWWLKANRLQRNVVWDAACVRPRTVRSDRGRGRALGGARIRRLRSAGKPAAAHRAAFKQATQRVKNNCRRFRNI